MLDPTPSTRQQGTKPGKNTATNMLRQNRRHPQRRPKWAKGPPQEKEGKNRNRPTTTSTRDRHPAKPKSPTPDRRPGPPASRNPGGNRGNRQEHRRYCNQRQIKRDEGPESHRGKETAHSPDSDDQKTHPRALKRGGKKAQ